MPDSDGLEPFYRIKLNQSNHITLHKSEEKMYTEGEVIRQMWFAAQYVSKRISQDINTVINVSDIVEVFQQNKK